MHNLEFRFGSARASWPQSWGTSYLMFYIIRSDSFLNVLHHRTTYSHNERKTFKPVFKLQVVNVEVQYNVNVITKQCRNKRLRIDVFTMPWTVRGTQSTLSMHQNIMRVPWGENDSAKNANVMRSIPMCRYWEYARDGAIFCQNVLAYFVFLQYRPVTVVVCWVRLVGVYMRACACIFKYPNNKSVSFYFP